MEKNGAYEFTPPVIIAILTLFRKMKSTLNVIV